MTDTPEAVSDIYRELILACSPWERFEMACRMFATAKSLVLAGIPRSEELSQKSEFRRHLFLRFYGRDFNPVRCEIILTHLEKA